MRKIKYWRRIWWIDERIKLKHSDWKILSDKVRQGTQNKIRVLGIREDPNNDYGQRDMYLILLKLPREVSEIFGPCLDNAFSKFREEANADDLRIRLRPHRYQDKERHLRTKKVVVEMRHHPRIIYQHGNFCGPEWRQNFVNFLQKAIA